MSATAHAVMLDGIVGMCTGHGILGRHGETNSLTIPFDVIEATHALTSELGSLIHYLFFSNIVV